MTSAMQRMSVPLQWAGLVGAVAGSVVAVVGFGLVLAGWLVAGFVAVALDVVAIRARSNDTALRAAIGKLVVLLMGVSLIPWARSNPAIPSLVPLDAGPPLLLASVLPSVVGALFRRVDR